MLKSFLQTKMWEEFRNSLGQKTFWIDGKLTIKMPLVLGQSYLYCPRANFNSMQEVADFCKKAKQTAKDEGIFFLRVEPEILDPSIDIDKLDCKKVHPRQPGQTLMIDLNNSLAQILDNAKQKTRYNIRLAQKKGIVINKETSQKAVEIFYQLAEETAQRDKIKFHDKYYYQKFIEVLGKGDMANVFIAYHEDKPLAAAITAKYGKTFYYLHGASTNEYRQLMAPYLLQWQMITEAKNEGYKWYDFWGTAPLKQEITNAKLQNTNKTQISNNKYKIKNEEHAWAGITRFKLGFAPTETTGKYIKYPGCFELSYGKKRYFLYSMFKKVM